MRTAIATLLFAVLAPAQNRKTLSFRENATAGDMNEMSAIATTVAGAQPVLDRMQRTITMSGSEENLAAAEWLFQQLERADDGDRPGATLEYPRPFGQGNETIAIFRVPRGASSEAMTSLITAIRSTADVQRIFAYDGAKAFAARASRAAVTEAEWIVRQVLPYDGPAPTMDSPAYPVNRPELRDRSAEIRIFRLPPQFTDAQVIQIWEAIQKIEEPGLRVLPFSQGLIIRSSVENVELAGWLVHELAKPPGNAAHQTTVAGIDDAVRLFFLGPDGASVDLATLVDSVKSQSDNGRVFAFTKPLAVLVRGRPVQISTAAGVISNFVPNVH